MSNNDMNKTVREFYKAVEGVKTKKSGGYDTQATVRRIEDGVAWVHIPDGVDETPAKLTISAKVGDVVQVRIVNGRAFLVGNASAPPTDNTEAVKAMGQAGLAAEAASIARQKADEAVEDAATAHEAAMSAQDSADIAQTAAENAQRDADDVAANLKSIVAGAATVEKAVSVMQTALEAVVDYDPDMDTTKEYFWHDASGAHVLGTDSGYRNDVDSSGMKIVEVSTEDTVAEFGASGAQIGKDNATHAEIDYRSFKMVDIDGDTYFRVNDMRGIDGRIYAEYVGDGSVVRLRTPSYVYPNGASNESVTVDGSPVSYTISASGRQIDLATAPASGASVVISYDPYNESTAKNAKCFTFGTRPIVSNVPYGQMSATIGRELVAGFDNQIVIGKYNNYTYAGNDLFVIGNGTSDSARSNAMTVDWNGNVTANDFVAGSMTLATLFSTSKMSQPSIYQSRIDNMTLYYYNIGSMCFVHGLFRVAISGAWADMAVATGFPTPAYNTSIPLTAANSSSHDSVICYINPQGSLCIHSVLAQYTWITVSGYYQRNL